MTPGCLGAHHDTRACYRGSGFDALTNHPVTNSFDADFFETLQQRTQPSTSLRPVFPKFVQGQRAPVWGAREPIVDPRREHLGRSSHGVRGDRGRRRVPSTDGVLLEYRTPRTGGRSLPTMSCR